MTMLHRAFTVALILAIAAATIGFLGALIAAPHLHDRGHAGLTTVHIQLPTL